MADDRQRSVFDWTWTELSPSSREAEARTLAEKLAGEFAAGDRVLDLGCGSGAFALEFAARAARVTAIDASRTLLETAREEGRRRELDVLWICGDILEHKLGEADHALALCIGNVLLDIPHPRFPAFAAAVAAALRPGGCWVIEYQDGVLRCAGMDESGEKMIQEEPERIVRRFLAYDPAQGTWSEEYHNLSRDERLEYTAYLYTGPLLAAILSRWFRRETSRQIGERSFLDCFRRR